MWQSPQLGDRQIAVTDDHRFAASDDLDVLREVGLRLVDVDLEHGHNHSHVRAYCHSASHRAFEAIFDCSMASLRDVVALRARLLLVGINPGLRSGALGHHFAGNGNPFWRLLHAARLTPTLLPYEENQRLAELHIGLTNLCPRTTRPAAELTRP